MKLVRYINMHLNFNQPSLLTMITGFEIATKRTRKRIFLEEMDQVVPWDALVALIAPHSPKSNTGRSPFGIEVLLRIHFLQQWFGLSDPAMEEAAKLEKLSYSEVPYFFRHLFGNISDQMLFFAINYFGQVWREKDKNEVYK